MKHITSIMLSLAVLGTVACSTMSQTPGSVSSAVFGTVELPGDTIPRGTTVLLVSLVEIEADSVLVQERILNLEEYPIAFTLRYDPNLVGDDKNYGISAALFVEGLLRYNNDPAAARVISDGFTQTVTVELQRSN